MRAMFHLVAALVMGAASPAFAAGPAPDLAAKFLQDYDEAVSRGQTRIENMAARREHQAKLDELAKRADRLFGRTTESDLGACAAAASYLRDAWTRQMVMAARSDPAKPFDVASLAWVSFQAGDSRQQCKLAVEGAENKRKH